MPFRPQALDTGFVGYQAPRAAKPKAPVTTMESIGAMFKGDTATLSRATQETIDTVGAAFRMENDVINAVDWLTRPQYKADPTFDVQARLKKDNLWNDYADNFLGVQSEAEYLAVSGRIAKEEKDRQTLGAAGLPGILAQMAAGIISPTALLPFVGGARGAKAIGLGLAAGLGGGVAQEVPLQLAQETRTLEESASSIALSAVIGGVLGGAVAFARRTPKEIADLMNMADVQGTGAIPRPREAGAAAVDTDVQLASSFNLNETVGQISPVVRTLTSRFQQARWMMAQVADAGLEFADSRAAALGGNVENRIKTYYGPAEKVMRGMDDAYTRYWFGNEGGRFGNQRAVLAGMNPNRTKMSRAEFKEAVGRAMQSGDVASVPEVAEVAKLIRSEIMDPIYKRAQEMGIYDAVKEGDEVLGDVSYLNRMYNQEAIRARQDKFEQILASHYEQKLVDQFRADFSRLSTAKKNADERIADFQRSPEEVAQLREDFEKQLLALDGGRDAELVDLEAAISDKRSAARAFERGTPERETALAEARALEQSGGEALAQTRAARADIRRRLANLRRAHSALTERQAKKLDKITRAEELNFNTLSQLTRKAQRVLASFDKLSDSKLDAELTKLRNDFNSFGATFDKVEDRIAETMEDDWWAPQEAGVSPTQAAPWTAPTELPDSVAQAAARREVLPSLATTVKEIAAEFDGLELPAALEKAAKGLVSQAGEVNWDKLDDFIDKADAFAKNSSNPNVQKAADLIGDLRTSLMEADSQVAQVVDRIKADYPRGLEAQRKFFEEQRYTDFESRIQFLEGWKKNDELPDWDESLPADGDYRSGGGPRLGPAEKFMYEQLIQEYRVAAVANKAQEAPTASNLSKLDKEQRKAFGLQMKLDDIAERLEVKETFDREGARAAVQEGLDEAIRRSQSIVERRAVRNARLAEQAQELDPTAAARRMDEVASDVRTRQSEFLDQWRERGADDIDPATGAANFKNFAASAARQTTNKILGNYVRLPGVDMIMQPKGAELARTLDIDGRLLVDDDGVSFLELDAEKLMMAYVRTLAPDIELARAFGGKAVDKELNENWIKLNEEATAVKLQEQQLMKEGIDPKSGNKKQFTQEQIDKRGLEIDNEFRAAQRDLEAVIERLRHNRGVPTDPRGLGARAAKIASNVNVLRFMSNVAISSIPDLARPIMKHGLLKTFKNGYIPFIKTIAEGKLSARQLRVAGAALDLTLHSRASQMYDIGDYMVRGSKFEKGLEYATSKIGIVALFDQWNVAMKQITGSIVNAQAMDALNIVAGGAKASAKDTEAAIRFLAANGIDDDYARRIWQQVTTNRGGENVGGQWWPNTEEWTDPDVVTAYNSMLVREVDNTIITPGVERPLMVDANPFTRLIFQFKSFGMSSTTKTFLAGMQGMRQGDMAFAQGGLISLALGTLSYYIAANIAGGTQKERLDSAFQKGDWGKFVDEAINRAGLLGIGADIQSAFAAIPATAPYVTFSGERTTRRGGSNLVETAFGPTFGDLIPTVADVATGINEPTQATAGQLRTLSPWQNHWALRRIYDQIEEAAASYLPERRQ